MAGAEMPLGESKALCSRSACRRDPGQAACLCTNRPRLQSGLPSGWAPTSGRQEKWLFRARAFVEAWHLHVRCLAPVARVQKCPGILLGPHDNAVERAHRGECLADRGLSYTRRSPVGTVRPGRRVPGTVPVIPGRGRFVREPQREGPDSCPAQFQSDT